MHEHVSRSNEHRGGKLVLAWLAALACCALIAPAASAGTFTVTFNAQTNAEPGCSIWQYHTAVAADDNFFQDINPCTAGQPMGVRFTGYALGLYEAAGAKAWIQTTAPAGIAITGTVVAPYLISNLNNNKGWGGGSFYLGGGRVWRNGDTSEADGGYSSPYWGFQMICGASACANPAEALLNSIQLTATESRGPALVALGSNNLWYQSAHYVWNPPGDPWPITLQATDPSGVCSMGAVVGGRPIGGPSATPNQTVWQQCPNQTWQGAGATVDTRSYVPTAGTLPFTLTARNAANVPGSASETLKVDNEPVALSLSGPTVASSTAGTQFVTAHATAGPSGVAIGCSVDGGNVQWQAGAVAQVPVTGAGVHVVSCRAHNGAVDPQGQPAYSATQSWSLNIGQPTVSAISFTKIVDKLKCHRVRKRIKVKGGRAKSVTVQRCHPRIAWKRETVFVKVRRHGKTVTVKRTKRVRVVLTPHAVAKTKERVAFGHGATVSGWLGTPSTAIAGAPVHVLTAPNNGLNQFALAAATTTAANGSWSVKLPAGPSRLVEAVYAGSAGLLPASSTPVLLNVPARIRLSISPRAVLWRDAIRVSGHLVGGYVPPDGVALRLLVRYPGTKHPTTLRALRTNAAGRFRFNWSYHSGNGVITYPLSVATTAAETDYAFAPNHSRVIHITFGKQAPRHHRRRQRGP